MLLFALALSSLAAGAWISLLLHEGAHAVVGRLTKLQIREIRVGLGPILLRLYLFGIDFRLAPLPICGSVKIFQPMRPSKYSRLAFVAAGPAMDLLLLAVLIAALMYNRDSEFAGAALVPAIMFQIWMVFRNLLPRHCVIYSEHLPNDMLSAWRILGERNDPNRLYREGYLNALRPYSEGDTPPFQLGDRSDRIASFWLEAAGSSHDRVQEAVTALERELSFAKSPPERLLIIESIAITILAGRARDCDARLDRLTAEAVALRPDLATLKGTRGAILVQLGRYEEASIMLAEAESSDDYNRCLTTAFQALAKFRLGRRDLAAKEFAASAAILNSHDWSGWIGVEIMTNIGREIGYFPLGDDAVFKSHITGTLPS